jgi:uncharacterized membrane protein (DUF485 family)
MDDSVIKRIQGDPNYVRLVNTRRTFAWTLSIVVLVVYYGYIALVAFFPDVIAIKVAGSITVGLALGVAIIVLSIALTGVYVVRANARYDGLTRAIVDANLMGGKR